MIRVGQNSSSMPTPQDFHWPATWALVGGGSLWRPVQATRRAALPLARSESVADVDVERGGRHARAVMAQPYPVLPQYEPLMDVVHLELELFDRFWKLTATFWSWRWPTASTPKSPTSRSTATSTPRPSHMVAKARSAAALAEVVASRAGEMVSLLHAEEANRFADIVALSPNEVIAREVVKWGLQGLWPKDARVAKKTEEFWWVDRQLTRLKGGDNHDIQQGFFIHSEPYTSPTNSASSTS